MLFLRTNQVPVGVIQVDLEVGLVVLNVGDAVELKTVFNLLTRHLMFKLYDFNPGLKYKFDCFFAMSVIKILPNQITFPTSVKLTSRPALGSGVTRLVIPDSDDSDSDTSEEHLVVDDDNEDNPRDLVLKILDDIVSRVISNYDTDPRVIESETHVSEVRVGHGIFTGFIASFMVNNIPNLKAS